MKKTILSIIISASMLFVATAARAQTITLSFDPLTQHANQGSLVDIALHVSGLGNGTEPSLSMFDLNVNFDPAILSYSNAVFGDSVLGDQLDIFGVGSNPMMAELKGEGRLNLFELSLDSASDLDAKQAASFTLVTLTFKTLLGGSSPLRLKINTMGDAYGDPISATVKDGNVTVVPIPATIWLMGSVLFVMLRMAGRRKNS